MGWIMSWHNQPDNIWTVSLLDLQPTDHVLEVGFGPGRAIELAARQTGKVMGIEVSETMLEEASKRNKDAIRAGKVNLKLDKLAFLSFPESTFDKVFAINCIYF